MDELGELRLGLRFCICIVETNNSYSQRDRCAIASRAADLANGFA